MKKKNLFITGGTTGIGLELALYFFRLGHKVAICGRRLQKLPADFPSEIIIYEVDVRNGPLLKEKMDDFKKQVGRIDRVIANAGISISDKKEIPDFKKAREIVDVNVLGFLNTLESSIAIMRNQGGGHIISIGSIAGRSGLPKTAAYSASKAFVNVMMESLAIDLPKYNIAITNIAPGFVDTPLTQKNKHPMPFLVGAPRAAELIAQAIEKKKSVFTFPWQMKIIISILYYLPRPLYIFLMRKLGQLFYGRNKEN